MLHSIDKYIIHIKTYLFLSGEYFDSNHSKYCVVHLDGSGFVSPTIQERHGCSHLFGRDSSLLGTSAVEEQTKNVS